MDVTQRAGTRDVLQVSLLGEQTVSRSRAGVLRPSSRALALIAFLACHAPSPQPRQLIAGLFWPDSTDSQALTNLRRELHHLRQLLGAGSPLVVTPRDLCWHDTGSCRVDVRVFGEERAAALAAAAAGDDQGVLAHGTRAIGEYRGDLLPGGYDDWLLEARARLQRECVELCDLVGAAQVRAGDLTAAAASARRRIGLQPLEEAGYRTLMELQADLGDRAGAVSTYHRCASVLERELGVVPGGATRESFRRILAQTGRDRHPQPPASAPAAGRPGPAAARLVGRAAELGELRDLWRAAAAGRGGLALVRGGAGVGKTRLVAEVAELARQQGAVVAASQCFGTPGRLALTPVADWLRSPAVQAAAATLDDVWRAEIARLMPSDGHSGRGAGPRAMVDAWQRHRFFEGLARALLAVPRPVLLVLDNVQWCDHETLDFITFCLGLAGGAPLLAAATLRDDGLSEDPALADWAVRMRATGLLTEISLTPLDPPGTAQLARAISGQQLPPPDAALLHATTGGFPLYVIEAVRSTAGQHGAALPTGDLAAVLRRRLAQGTAAAREVAGLAAAVGTNFSLDLLTEASDLPAGAVVAAVDELWRRHIMQDRPDGYDFSHDMLRDAAYAEISPPRRWLLHRRVAQALELLHADDPDPVAALLAEQYARGGRPERAVAYYRRAAEVAAGVFAHAEAIRLHRKALSIVRDLPAGRDRDQQELAVLEPMAAPLNALHGYSSPELQEALERSVSLAGSLGRRDSMITALVGLWASRFVQGRITDSYQTATRALRLIDPDSDLSGPAHFAVGGAAVSLGMPAEGLRHLQLAAQLASGAVSLTVGTRPDVHAAAWAAHAHWLLGDDAGAVAASRGAVRLARTIGHPYSLAVALAYACITHQMRGDLPALRAGVAELHDLCGRYRFAYYREWALVLDGWASADASLTGQGIARLRAHGSFARMPYWLSLLADVAQRQGRAETARATLDAAIVAGRARRDLWWLPEVLRMRAAHDRGPAAGARLRAAAELARDHGSVALLRRCQQDLAGAGGHRADGTGPGPAGPEPAVRGTAAGVRGAG